ncbi:hypothetical protein QYF61_023026 [Mycteria americana]|uniref:Uncharacterized protein n=1 Tax=Mycteria americana TaxID=33587 RepID=A0AAN7P073_MYCAM|nr:hypothetical protein QYF61_023026 [Mycteria americana]
MARHGAARNSVVVWGMAWHGTAQHSTAQHSQAYHSAEGHSVAGHGVVWQGTAQHSKEWHSAEWHDMTGHSTVWKGRLPRPAQQKQEIAPGKELDSTEETVQEVGDLSEAVSHCFLWAREIGRSQAKWESVSNLGPKGLLRILLEGSFFLYLHAGEGTSRKAKHSIASWSREVIVPVCTALVWPHLKHCVQFCVLPSTYEGHQSLRGRATKMVKGVEGKTYEEWLRSLGLVSLEKAEG